MSKLLFCISTIFILAGLTAISASAEEEHNSLQEKLRENRIIVIAPVEGCDNEIEKYCQQVGSDTRDILSCLSENEESLSAACRQGALSTASLIVQAGAKLDKAIIACQEDIDALCQEELDQDKKIIACLKAKQKEVSEQCIVTLKETGFWNYQNEGIWRLKE